MKKILILLGIIFLSFSTGYSQSPYFYKYDSAFAFKQVKFESNILNVLKIIKCQKIDNTTYSILDKKYLFWGDIIFDAGALYFDKNKFISVRLITKKKSLKEMGDYLVAKYDSPHDADDKNAIWFGNKIVVALEETNGFVSLIITSKKFHDGYSTSKDNM